MVWFPLHRCLLLNIILFHILVRCLIAPFHVQHILRELPGFLVLVLLGIFFQQFPVLTAHRAFENGSFHLLQRTMSAFTSSGSDRHSLQICRECPLPLNCSLLCTRYKSDSNAPVVSSFSPPSPRYLYQQFFSFIGKTIFLPGMFRIFRVNRLYQNSALWLDTDIVLKITFVL